MDTYSISIYCTNCGHVPTCVAGNPILVCCEPFEIPKGTTVGQSALKNKKCAKCGCRTYTRKLLGD